MFATTPEYSAEYMTLLTRCSPERITRETKQSRGDCVLYAESNSSDRRGLDISRKVELKAKITDLRVINCVAHVKVN
jgi:hypothetical protein